MSERRTDRVFSTGVDPVTTGDPSIPFARKSMSHHVIKIDNVVYAIYDHSFEPWQASGAFDDIMNGATGELGAKLEWLNDGATYFRVGTPPQLREHGVDDIRDQK